MGLFSNKETAKECILIAGNTSTGLIAAFVQQAQQQGLAVCQFLHGTAGDCFSVTAVNGQNVLTCCTDLTDTHALNHCMKKIKKRGYAITLGVILPLNVRLQPTPEITAKDIQQLWQADGLMAAAVAQVMVQHMLKLRQGTLIFLGAGQGRNIEGRLATNAVHAGIRALSQSLAREFQPKGLHISYMALGHWNSHDQALSQVIANTCWHVYQQPISAWSQELSC